MLLKLINNLDELSGIGWIKQIGRLEEKGMFFKQYFRTTFMVESIGHADSLTIEFFDKVCFRDEQSLFRSGRREIFVLILSEKTKKINFVKVDLMLGEVH